MTATSGSRACRRARPPVPRRPACGLVFAALLAALAGCAEKSVVAPRAGAARMMTQTFTPGELAAPFCSFSFRDQAPGGLDPALTILRGGVMSLHARTARAILPENYGVFVGETWVLTAALAYDTASDCSAFGCSYYTVYSSGRLALNRQETTALGQAIAAARGPVELRLQGFHLGEPSGRPGRDYIFRLPHIVGEFLATPDFDCTRLEGALAPVQ